MLQDDRGKMGFHGLLPTSPDMEQRKPVQAGQACGETAVSPLLPREFRCQPGAETELDFWSLGEWGLGPLGKAGGYSHAARPAVPSMTAV